MSLTAEEWIRPVSKANLSDQAHAALREALMLGRLTPGEALPLRPMSARFGISPTPMREALMRLVGEGALVLDARGTTRVPRLTLAELREIRAIRLDLEGRTAAMAADTATEAEIDVLALLQSELHDLQRAGDFRAAVGLNTVFHLSLCRLAGQPITFKIVENLWVRCGPILSHLYDAGLPPGWEPHPHTRVIDALRRRDRAEAHGALRYDIEHGGRGLEQSLGPD